MSFLIGQRLLAPERGRVALENFDVPSPKAGELLLKTHCTLVSPGTERAFLLGLENAQRPFPMRVGYNHAGEVIALGEGMSGFAVGERVVSEGNHSSHVIAQAARTLKIPAGLTLEHAAFFNMIGIALQGVRKARVEIGDSVLVLGAGLVGQLAAQCAKLQGGFPVIVADVSEKRLAVARDCGADLALNPKNDDFAKIVQDATNTKGPAVVIEATGAAEPVNRVFQLAARYGRVVLLASTRGESERVNFYRDVHLKGLTIFGAHNFVRPERDSTPAFWSWRDDAELILKLLAARRFPIERLITHRVAAADAARAYNELLLRWSDDLIGAVIDWR